MRWTRQRPLRLIWIAGQALARERSAARQTNDAEAYGKTVWSWRPWLASSRRRCSSPDRVRDAVNSPTTEARGIRLRGERGISRKTIAQGMPECSGCTCMLVCASTSISCTRDRGCSKHPAFPCALLSGKRLAKPGRNAPRECGGVFSRHRPRRRTIQYSRSRSELSRETVAYWIPAFARMTAVGAVGDSGIVASRRPGMTIQ
jgi:hypothetical protein